MLTTTGRRNAVAFFLLGMLNNLTFVVNNAGASDILSNAIGVVYLVNIMPELCCKLTAPFWWRLSSYRAKIIFAGLCMCASHLLVLLPGLPVEIRLLGVALGDLGGGLGEATHLALSQHFTNPSIQISAWSSGTGMAGVVGYLLAMYALHPPGLSPHGQLVVQLSIGVGIFLTYWLCFFCLLVRPRDGAASSVSTTLGRSAAAVTASGTVNMGGSVVGTRPLLADMSDEGDALPVDDLSAWSSESTLPPVAPPTASHSSSAALRSTRDKLRLQLYLLRYICPLIIVYWAEYAAQSGAWTAFALPAAALHSDVARKRAYDAFNLAYQVGVLVSRSCGKLCRLRLAVLWALAWLQVLLLVGFVADGATQRWVGPSLFAPAGVVGLLGGTLYVQTALAIDTDLPPAQREIALATASVGSPIGILLADVSGLFIQWCLFAFLGIHGGGQGKAVTGHCPLNLVPAASSNGTHLDQAQLQGSW